MLGRLYDLVCYDRPLFAGEILRFGYPLLNSWIGPESLRLEGDVLIALATCPGPEYVANSPGRQHAQLAHWSLSSCTDRSSP